MKLSGTVLNSRNYEPIALAKIRLDVQDNKMETLFFTDEHGYYEFKSEQDHIGQTVTYTIEKDGFEEKTFSTIIDKAEIHKKFLLRETEALKDKFATLKGFGYGIIIASVIFAILIASLIGSNPVAEYDKNVTVGLNDLVYINMTIDKQWDWMPFVDPSWELKSEEQWIQFNKSKGQKSDTVQITLLTPDFQFSPGNTDVKFSLINTKLDFIDSVKLNFFADVMVLNFTIEEEKKKPKLDVRVAPTFEDPHKFGISIKNVGDGAPWWSLRSDKNWIELWDGSERYDSNKRRFDDGMVYFKINMSNIQIENECAQGRIILGYNNDGKDVIHIYVCKKGSSIEISSTIESWYLPDYYNTKLIEPTRPSIFTELNDNGLPQS